MESSVCPLKPHRFDSHVHLRGLAYVTRAYLGRGGRRIVGDSDTAQYIILANSGRNYLLP